MITFIIIGAVGMLLLLISLPLGDVFELGDGALSGTSLGAGAVAFGAIGAIVTANGLPTVWAYVASAVVAVIAVIGVQLVIKQLRDTEDGQPRTLTGGGGVVTSTITPHSNGEVSLDDPHEVERRLAWADVTIPSGARIVVVEQSGSRVKVAPAPTTTPPIHDV
ncbi:NfeD family protein [Actinotalea sp. K2]|uniref:NfeD family protein n=1 Tax=Actinotalea sp. K2 TaxID=2939438 RepID=UPI0020170D01|nr:NfeD family protein [Actinotalea sp. K2]MCL3860959.1 hypothetical protein [Actinotalea sp. K2]